MRTSLLLLLLLLTAGSKEIVTAAQLDLLDDALRPPSADDWNTIKKANDLREARQFDDARRIYLTLTNVLGRLGANAEFHLGELDIEARKERDAADHFSRSIAVDPTYPAPYVTLGVIFAKRGQAVQTLQPSTSKKCLIEAGSLLDRASGIRDSAGKLALDPSLVPSLWFWRGMVYLMEGQRIEARTAFQSAIRDVPKEFQSTADYGHAIEELQNMMQQPKPKKP